MSAFADIPARMRIIGRSLVSMFVACIMLVTLAFPARAGLNYTGTYRIVTGTGKHMIDTLIENSNFGIDGMYAGNHGVAGRLTSPSRKQDKPHRRSSLAAYGR
jgi:hypothetical protein